MRLTGTWTVLLVGLLLCSSGTAAESSEEKDEFVCSSHGFAITRPGESWSLQETADGASGSFSLKILPPGSAGETLLSVEAKPLTEDVAVARELDKALDIPRIKVQSLSEVPHCFLLLSLAVQDNTHQVKTPG